MKTAAYNSIFQAMFVQGLAIVGLTVSLVKLLP
jgi:hypothetical protein